MREKLPELTDINKEISSISGSLDKEHNKSDTHTQKKLGRPKSYAPHFLLFVLAASCLSILFYFGPEITGFVTFSESVVKVDSGMISIQSSGPVSISTDLENINSMMLSGTVYGSGTAAVFVMGPTRNYLAYYFEGDAKEGVSFNDMCYDTCHLESLNSENTLLFELDGTSIDIDNIKYTYSRIIDFDLEPRSIVMDYSKEKVKLIELVLTNNQLTDYSVILYIDGPLSNSFSWQGSLIHMTSEEPLKIIPVTVNLPNNLPEGTYTHKITARYVPPDTYDFVGESPVAETFITIEN